MGKLSVMGKLSKSTIYGWVNCLTSIVENGTLYGWVNCRNDNIWMGILSATITDRCKFCLMGFGIIDIRKL
ncbi:hypothetical protein GIB67_020693, partial [Kingdonia uniflora]